MCSQEKTSIYPKLRALTRTHMRTHIHTVVRQHHPTVHEALQCLIVYFQQHSRKQILFAFLHSTFNFLRSFVSVGIFPYFILFLLLFCERDFHWNAYSQGPATMRGWNKIGWPIYRAVLFISSSLLPPALDWSWTRKMAAVSYALALQMK